MRRIRLCVTLVALGVVIVGAPVTSHADGTAAASPASALPEGLMGGLALHAAHFEDMKKRGAFTMLGHMDELDGDGKPSETKEILFRSTPTPTPMDRITNVIRYTENGKDKTADAQKKANEGRKKRLDDPSSLSEMRKKDLRLPFLAEEQPRYVFSVAERDVAGGRVRIAFVPKTPAENAIKGSAWVDEQAREVLSLGFSLSKNPTFVDHVEVAITFAMATPLGRAPSKIDFDGRGSFLFLRKHLRGTATFSEPRVAF